MKGTVKSYISANGFKRFLESLEQYFIQKLQILINFEFVCFGSTKANKARIALSPWRCRYCKSDLVRFGLSSSLRKYVSTIYPTKGVISEIWTAKCEGRLPTFIRYYPVEVWLWVLMCTLFVFFKSTVFFALRSWNYFFIKHSLWKSLKPRIMTFIL